MADGTRIGSPLLDVAQANKETTHNQAIQNLEDYVGHRRRMIGRPTEWASYSYEAGFGAHWDSGSGAAPGTRAVKLVFHRMRIPHPVELTGVVVRLQAAGSPTTPKFRWALYKPHATYETPDVKYATEISAISQASFAYRSLNCRATFTSAIKASALYDFLGGGDFLWLATMYEIWYAAGGGGETGPSFYKNQARYGFPVGDGSNIFDKDLNYTPTLSPNDITASFPTGIGGTLSNFSNNDTEGSAQFGFECARASYP